MEWRKTAVLVEEIGAYEMVVIKSKFVLQREISIS